jgi:hypothetical protein
MHKIFATFVWFGDEIIRRIVYLVGFFVLLSSAMSWAASYIAPIAQYGWGAVVFAGIGVACAVTLVVSGAFVAWRYFNPLTIPSTSHEAQAITQRKAEAIVFHPFIDIEQSFLYSEPPTYEAWKAKIISTKTVSSVQVCLDLSSHSGGAGYNFWNPKRRLILRENVNFIPGAEVVIDLMEIDNSRDTPSWHWVTNMHEREPVSFTCHRCQLVFIAAQEPPDYFNFIVDFHYEEKLPQSRDGKTSTRYEKAPSLIGEHRFLYAREWKK